MKEKYELDFQNDLLIKIKTICNCANLGSIKYLGISSFDNNY